MSLRTHGGRGTGTKGLGKAPALHHALSVPALLGPACSAPPPGGKFPHRCPGYLSCILRVRRMTLAVLYESQVNLCKQAVLLV